MIVKLFNVNFLEKYNLQMKAKENLVLTNVWNMCYLAMTIRIAMELGLLECKHCN